MRRLLKVILMASESVLLVGCMLFAMLRFGLFRHSCDHYETVLSRDTHGSVVSVFDACTTIGSSNTARVDFIQPNGHRVELFSYVPWGGEISYHGVAAKAPFEPAATWLRPNDLRISIGTVGQVLQRRTEVDGVHLTYDIGVELYK
jgi:hypothetical protein